MASEKSMPGVLIAFGKKPDGEENTRLLAARAVLKAIKADDAAKFDEALATYIEECDYHSEPEAEDTDSDDESESA